MLKISATRKSRISGAHVWKKKTFATASDRLHSNTSLTASAGTFSLKLHLGELRPWRLLTSILFLLGKLNIMDLIDNVSRDSKDGTYRCPQCQTPFTRRSNLRRHFQIRKEIGNLTVNSANNYSLDLRGTSMICEVCNEEHSTKYCLSYNVSDGLLHLFFFPAGTAFRIT